MKILMTLDDGLDLALKTHALHAGITRTGLIEQIFKDWFLDHRQEVTEHTSSHNKQFNNTLNTFCKTSGPVHSDSEFYHVKKTNDVQPSQAQSNEQEAPDESADSAAPTSEVNSDGETHPGDVTDVMSSDAQAEQDSKEDNTTFAS